MDEKVMKHGAFSWFELMTNDVDAAKDFYFKLFGWETEKMEMEGGMIYTVVKVNGEAAGGMMAMPSGAGGMPSMWGIYVTVDDVDETARSVKKMGGKVLVAPQDIPQVGRFCVFQDPQGAILSAITYRPM